MPDKVQGTSCIHTGPRLAGLPAGLYVMNAAREQSQMVRIQPAPELLFLWVSMYNISRSTDLHTLQVKLLFYKNHRQLDTFPSIYSTKDEAFTKKSTRREEAFSAFQHLFTARGSSKEVMWWRVPVTLLGYTHNSRRPTTTGRPCTPLYT